MFKTILMSGLLSSMLLLSGCGDDNNEGESRLETQQMLDNGDFAGVISKLESTATTRDDYINLASAYMGKAGLTLTRIITSITSSDDTEDNGFSSFVKGISESSSPTAISDLGKANDFYRKVIGDRCVLNRTLSASERDVCLYVGLANTSRAAVTIDLITEDIASFGIEGDGEEDYKLKASACALEFAFNGNTGEDCNITQDGNVTFTVLNRTYDKINIDVNGTVEQFQYLIDNNRTVLTKGYCSNTDFSTRTENTVNGYYVCPINESPNEEDITTTGVLVEVLNGGLSALNGAATDDIKSDIDEFKCEVLGGTYENEDCNISLDTQIDEQSIIDYLNKENK
jgi:hypothetical protein